MRMPQPIPYQGSKRIIAPQILAFLPSKMNTLLEPFAGSAALSIRAASKKQAHRFLLNDLNRPLMELLAKIINEPEEIANDYEKLWQAQLGQERTFYDQIRQEFNATQQPGLLLYLLARCVKASVRYNSDGEFNQGPDNRRKGRHPDSMRTEIRAVSDLLKGKTVITSLDYQKMLDFVQPDRDVIYMDPPYQGTSTGRDPRYLGSVSVAKLVEFLTDLNDLNVMYALSYDGRKGLTSYGVNLPGNLNLRRVELKAGRSTQSTLLGGKDITYESLYLSSSLVGRIESDGIRLEGVQSSLAPGEQLEFSFV